MSATKNEVAAEPAKIVETEVEAAKVAEPTKTTETAAPAITKKKPTMEQHNVIIVRRNFPFKALAAKVKSLLREKFEEIELHAVDTEAFLSLTIAANVLQKYGYCTISRLKTKTHQARESEDSDARVVLRPKLVCHLKKTAEFDSIFDEFETRMKAATEEAKEDLHAVETSVLHNKEGDKDLIVSAEDEQKEGGEFEDALGEECKE